MRRALRAGLWMMGLSFLIRIPIAAYLWLPDHGLGLRYAVMAAIIVWLVVVPVGIAGAASFVTAAAYALWTGMAIPWSRWHTGGALAGAALAFAAIFLRSVAMSGELNVLVPEMSYVESLLVPRRFAPYLPADPTADPLRLATRLAAHAIYGSLLGAGVGEILYRKCSSSGTR